MAIFRFIRVRLTLWYVLLLAVTLAAFSAGVYLALRANLYSNLDESLESRAAFVSGLAVSDGRLAASGIDVPGDPVEGEEFVRVYDSSGDALFDNTSEQFAVPDDPDGVQSALAGRTDRRHVDTGSVDLRVMTAPIRADSGIVGAVQVGLSEDDVRETLSMLLVIIALGYPLTLAIAGGGGVFLAGRALSPIDDLTRAARKISAEDLSRRLDLPLPDDEVGRLARTFDAMIQRLDESFRRQRRFTADASHELRTPLTAIKGQTEVALQTERGADAYREVLGSVNAEVDRMIRLVGSLLTLARADARQIPVNWEQVELDRLVADAVDQVTPAAAEREVSVNVHSDGTVRLQADQDLLLQLLLNLLDNAVKHTPPGGSIEISTSARDGPARVTVSDSGPGIPAEHLPHVFDRFYRVDAARSRADGGAGLGLSICEWIAEAHGGSIRAESGGKKGAVFTVTLPLS